ncbi:sulfhydryl oxidase 2 [Drosophila eugracilis]|uniref:sulfhydryl oxidase 2 n=1 Tax=Drosophila eugracilis TaxID=29029 RepID=UPI001BDA264A|nr:sulfhydryl oxidase 2 [Drosophila eugracilis]
MELYINSLNLLLLLSTQFILFGISELLYKPEDNVEQLNFTTFEAKLGDPTSGKLVKFYNAFCEDSQNYLPGFRNLSRRLYKWRRILKIYVLDCSQDDNNKICRSYIIRSTPTLRYFPQSYQRMPNDLGTDITSRNVREIQSDLALFLKDLDHFNMFKREDNVADIFKDNANLKYVVMVFQMCLSEFLPHFETGNSDEERFASLDDCNENNPVVAAIGRNTLLELLPYEDVIVRIFDDHEIYTKFGISPVPNLLVMVNRDGNHLLLTPEVDTSHAYVAAVQQFLIFINKNPQKPLPKTLPPNIEEALRYEIFEHHKHHSHRIFRADLERAIDQILNVELLRPTHFVGAKLTVLRNFLRLLKFLSPLKEEAKERLVGLYYSMRLKRKLTRAGLQEILLKSLKDYQFDGKQYVGCIASRPSLRGFNCSLWTLFHYLSVESEHIKIASVVLVFHGYVKLFMNCKECSQKIKEFKKIYPIANITENNQEILWLWRAHNYVNKELAGDSTEDPLFPKIQFPSEKDCPNCRGNKSEWRTDEVLKYLKTIYCLKNLSWFGMSSAKAYT